MNLQLSMQAVCIIPDKTELSKTDSFVQRLTRKVNKDKNIRQVELLEWRSPFYLGS